MGPVRRRFVLPTPKRSFETLFLYVIFYFLLSFFWLYGIFPCFGIPKSRVCVAPFFTPSFALLVRRTYVNIY